MKNKSIKILVLLIGFIIFTLLIGKTSVYGHRELEDPRTYDKPINAISLCNTQISLSKSQYNYTGTECKPSVTVTYYGSIVDSSKYTVQYKNNINIGTATVVVSAISGSGYKGSNSKSFNISKNSLSNFTISLSQSAYTYDGTPKKPTVTVKYQNRVIPSSNYSVSYYDYINPGTGKVTISGKNNLSGTANKTFKITKRPIANCDITLSHTKFEYDGGAKTPNVIIKHNNKILTKDTSYTLAFSNNTNAGTATVKITGKGNYSGTATKTFTIYAKNINNYTISLSKTAYTYSGSERRPTVTLRYKGKEISSSNYSLEYYNNIKIGTATVKIIGKGNIQGQTTRTFKICKLDLTNCEITLRTQSYAFDGTAKTPSIVVKYQGNTILSSNYKVKYIDNINPGVGKVYLEGINNLTGYANKTFTINKKEIPNCSIKLSETSYEYDGVQKYPSVTVKNNNKITTKGIDYVLEYYNNIKVGTASVKITGIGNYTGTVTKTFTISKKDISKCSIVLEQTVFVYDGTEKKPKLTIKNRDLTLTKDNSYTMTFSNNIKAGTASIKITGKGNYTGTTTKTFTIKQLDLGKCQIDLSDSVVTYDKKEQKPEVIITYKNRALLNNTDFTVSYSNNINAGKGKISINGKGSCTGQINKEFTIVGKDIGKCTLTILGEHQIYYSEKPIDLTISLMDGNKSLQQGNDYTIKYYNNKEVSNEAKFVIKGIGNYKSSIERSFAIKEQLLDNCEIEIDRQVCLYTGEDIKPNITIKNHGINVSRENYDVEYENNNNIGSMAKVKITAKGKKYMGKKTIRFSIVKPGIESFVAGVIRRHKQMEAEGWRYYEMTDDWACQDIEKSIRLKTTCCATYVACAIYEAGLLTEDQINKYDYNGCAGLTAILDRVDEGHEIWTKMNPYETDLQVGDIVFFSWNGDLEPEHVSIYAGNGQWYDAGSTDAIQTSTIQLNMNGTMTTLYRLNK